MFALLADVVLVSHFALVVFVVGGLPLIVVGNVMGWRWVNAASFRVAHLAAIVVVAAEAWLGLACPLTTLEIWLRAHAAALPSGGVMYGESFVAFWLHRLLFFTASPWVFVAAYSVFAALVIAAWIWLPPRFTRNQSRLSKRNLRAPTRID